MNFIKKLLKKSDHIKKREYKDYDSYLSHQKEKTLDPIRRKKWLNEQWEEKYEYFKSEYSYVFNKLGFKAEGRGLGLGARTGQEVQAMLDLGLDGSIGVDLVPCEPLVIEADIHNLPFDSNEFTFSFTNIYDHSLYPDKFLSEIIRVLKPDGLGILHLQVGMVTDDYGVVDITSTGTIEKKIKKYGGDLLIQEEITNGRDVIDMTTRIVFKKRGVKVE
jgi:SAM-dependent methyltransferase